MECRLMKETVAGTPLLGPPWKTSRAEVTVEDHVTKAQLIYVANQKRAPFSVTASQEWATEHDSHIRSTTAAPAPTDVTRFWSIKSTFSFKDTVQELCPCLMLTSHWPGLNHIAAREAGGCGAYFEQPYLPLIGRVSFRNHKGGGNGYPRTASSFCLVNTVCDKHCLSASATEHNSVPSHGVPPRTQPSPGHPQKEGRASQDEQPGDPD